MGQRSIPDVFWPLWPCFWLAGVKLSTCMPAMTNQRWKFKHAMWKTCSTNVEALFNTEKEGEENKAEALISISALLFPSQPASIKVRISENIESRWLWGEKQTSERERMEIGNKGGKRGTEGSQSPAFSCQKCGSEPQMFVDRGRAISNSWSGIRFLSVSRRPPTIKRI